MPNQSFDMSAVKEVKWRDKDLTFNVCDLQIDGVSIWKCAPTPTPDGVVHFSSKIISNASSDTESKAFENDAFSDITAVGVYEIQSDEAFLDPYVMHPVPVGVNGYPTENTLLLLSKNRAGDGWTSSTALERAVPTCAKQDIKSMAIPAGTTVKFSLDWTHLGATYINYDYTREDLIFFEITGPALIVDLSPGEELPDASAGTHLASVGITEAKVYNWYDILQYPEYSLNQDKTWHCGEIFNKSDGNDQNGVPLFVEDVVEGAKAQGVDSIVNWRDHQESFSKLIGITSFAYGSTVAFDSLFKLPPSISSGAGVQPLNQRTLRNMPYTSTLMIEQAPPDGVVHFSSKIISNASSDTESKAFENDAFSDITAVGVYEIQSTYAFEIVTLAPGPRIYKGPSSKLDPDRAGDGWNNSTGLGKAVPTVAKQDLKSMAIPAGTTVKFSLDWTHLGATYINYDYTREDLIFFEITGPALIVDLSPGEELPDASAGTHLASVGITTAKVYNWYNILQYPEFSFGEEKTYGCGKIFNKSGGNDQHGVPLFVEDVKKASEALSINSLYYNSTVEETNFTMPEFEYTTKILFTFDESSQHIDNLFKVSDELYEGSAIVPEEDRRTLRNMPYTSTLIIE